MEGGGRGPSDEDLWAELSALKARVELLEHALQRTSAGPARQHGASTARDNEAQLAAPESSRQGEPSALESRIGAQIFNRVGAFAILAGAAWFLKLAIDRAWIGPGARVVIGLLASVGLVAWSERFRRSGSLAFSYTLKALGAGIAYLSLWAAFSLYHLLPSPVAFAAMVAVTVTYALLAWRQGSELLAALALAGGFATPALLSTGGDQQIFLFSYLLLLDAGALILMAVRPWPKLAIGAFAGTTAYFAFWWWSYFSIGDQLPTAIFIALFFALFSIAPLLPLRRQTGAVSGLLAGLPVAVGVCAYLEAHGLMVATANASSVSWVAVALGAVSLALVVFAHRFIVPTAVPDAARAAKLLRVVHLSLAAGFFALAALMGFYGYGVDLCWLAELLLLTVTSVYWNHHELGGTLRGGSAALLALSFGGLVFLREYDRLAASAVVFVNSHFATYLAGLAVFAAAVALSRRMLLSEAGSISNAKTITLNSWLFLAGFAAFAFSVIALISVSSQIDLFWHQQIPLGLHSMRRPAYVDFTYSAWFMLYGAALMAVGFWQRSAFLRWQALLLLTLSIGKVFLFDTSRLEEGYRVLSFLGLGVVLLAISFAYQRDWLALRGSAR